MRFRDIATMNLSPLLLAAIFVSSTLGQVKVYDQYKVFRTLPYTDEQLSMLSGYRYQPGFDFWTQAFAVNRPIDVMVYPAQIDPFEQFLRINNFAYSTLINNVQNILNQEKWRQMSSGQSHRRSRNQPKISFDTYNRHPEINAYLDYLAATYPNFVSVQTIGTSFEGRQLKLLTISKRTHPKPAIFIDGGIHAREWISPAVVLYIIQELVENNPKHQHLLDLVDWYILPVINPDGYEFAHTVDRFWRKTRSINQGSECMGVDGNRNYDIHWMEVGSDSDPCSEIYAGPKPFSESEIIAHSNFIYHHRNQIALYLSFHSYGQFVLHSFAFTCQPPADIAQVAELARQAANALYNFAGTNYTVGSPCELLAPAGGGGDDWAKAKAGIKYSYTMELPGGGDLGFDLPPDRIKSVVRETFEAVKVFGNFIASSAANGNLVV